KIDLLRAELQGESVFRKFFKSHPEHFAVKRDAPFQVARGEDDVVDVVDHTIRFSFSEAIWEEEKPRSLSTASVCSPSFGAGERMAPGVAESLGSTPGTLSGSPSPAVTCSMTPRAAKCGSAAMSAAV